MANSKAIRFGLDDTLACPECGGSMHLTRRRPHPIHGEAFEMQTFTCRNCKHETQRGIDHLGEAV
jgi:C4-type Zn-finger protein